MFTMPTQWVRWQNDLCAGEETETTDARRLLLSCYSTGSCSWWISFPFMLLHLLVTNNTDKTIAFRGELIGRWLVTGQLALHTKASSNTSKISDLASVGKLTTTAKREISSITALKSPISMISRKLLLPFICSGVRTMIMQPRRY